MYKMLLQIYLICFKQGLINSELSIKKKKIGLKFASFCRRNEKEK